MTSVAVLAFLVLVGTGLIACGESPRDAEVTRVEIAPTSVLLTSVGATRALQATAYDAAGAPVDADVTWSSTHAEVVGVSGDGTLSAKAVGSSQVVAEAGGVRSASILALVAMTAPGVIPVDDDQIVAGPFDLEDVADPGVERRYGVTLQDLEPAVGDRLIGTGSSAIAGRVVEVRPAEGGVTATVALLPLDELLPDLSIDESIDLTSAEVVIRPALARLYDVVREGSRFTFTPKPDFEALTGAAVDRSTGPAFGPPMAALGGPVDPGRSVLAAEGTFPAPFDDCAWSTPTMPIQLAVPPVFTVEVDPRLDVRWTPDLGLERWVVTTNLKVQVKAEAQATVAFEGKVVCELELFAFVVPVTGPGSWIIAGLIPVGVGIELSGKVTVSSMTVTADGFVKLPLEIGVVCPGGTACAFHRSLGDVERAWDTKVDWPDGSISDARIEASFSAYGWVRGAIGNRLFRWARINAFEARVGLRLKGDWAPRLVQILADEYRSAYTLEVEATAGIKGNTLLDPGEGRDNAILEIVRLLGISELTVLEFRYSREIAGSPRGTMTTDRPNYLTGESASITVAMEPDALTFLGLHQVKEVLLVRYSGGRETVLARAAGVDGQTTYQFAVTSSGPLAATELFAFVVTKMPSLDVFALELDRAITAGPAATPPADRPCPTYTVTVGGVTNTSATHAEAAAGDPFTGSVVFAGGAGFAGFGGTIRGHTATGEARLPLIVDASRAGSNGPFDARVVLQGHAAIDGGRLTVSLTVNGVTRTATVTATTTGIRLEVPVSASHGTAIDVVLSMSASSDATGTVGPSVGLEFVAPEGVVLPISFPCGG